jgi:hypothetical protein
MEDLNITYYEWTQLRQDAKVLTDVNTTSPALPSTDNKETSGIEGSSVSLRSSLHFTPTAYGSFSKSQMPTTYTRSLRVHKQFLSLML